MVETGTQSSSDRFLSRLEEFAREQDVAHGELLASYESHLGYLISGCLNETIDVIHTTEQPDILLGMAIKLCELPESEHGPVREAIKEAARRAHDILKESPSTGLRSNRKVDMVLATFLSQD